MGKDRPILMRIIMEWFWDFYPTKVRTMSFISLREKLDKRLLNLYEMMSEDLKHSNMDSYEIKRLLLDIINHISTIDSKIKQLELKENISKINRQYE